jgi:hypothetical protein
MTTNIVHQQTMLATTYAPCQAAVDGEVCMHVYVAEMAALDAHRTWHVAPVAAEPQLEE